MLEAAFLLLSILGAGTSVATYYNNKTRTLDGLAIDKIAADKTEVVTPRKPNETNTDEMPSNQQPQSKTITLIQTVENPPLQFGGDTSNLPDKLKIDIKETTPIALRLTEFEIKPEKKIELTYNTPFLSQKEVPKPKPKKSKLDISTKKLPDASLGYIPNLTQNNFTPDSKFIAKTSNLKISTKNAAGTKAVTNFSFGATGRQIVAGK